MAVPTTGLGSPEFSPPRTFFIMPMIETLYDPKPMEQAEQTASHDDIAEIIKDVPPFVITVALADDQGTLVIDSGLDETKIVKGTTLRDPVAIMKVILAAQDTLVAITSTDLRKMAFTARKKKRCVSTR